MTYQIAVIEFRGDRLEGVRVEGSPWFRVQKIFGPLGYPSAQAVEAIFKRHKKMFHPSEVQKMDLPTEGGVQRVVAYSLRAVAKLALLSPRVPKSLAYIDRLTDDMLDHFERGRIGAAPKALPGAFPITNDTKMALLDLRRAIEAGDHPVDVIEAYLEGSRQAPSNPEIDDLMAERRALCRENKVLQGIAAIDRELHKKGCSDAWIRLESKRLARLPQDSAGLIEAEPDDAAA